MSVILFKIYDILIRASGEHPSSMKGSPFLTCSKKVKPEKTQLERCQRYLFLKIRVNTFAKFHSRAQNVIFGALRANLPENTSYFFLKMNYSKLSKLKSHEKTQAFLGKVFGFTTM